MNKLSIYTLKALRKVYAKLYNVQPLPKPACEQDPDVASKLIYDMLMDDKPCMIARFGSTEIQLIANYIGVEELYQKRNIINYIKGNGLPWWWESKKIEQIYTFSGFFPKKIELIKKFCVLAVSDYEYVDILGSWRKEEVYFEELYKKCNKVNLEILNPFFSKYPWTKALEGKKVLVVHPFAKTIELQYQKRELLFENNLLPEFELKTIKAVQSLAGEKTSFNDWFEALEYMKSEIDKQDYDICLIGAGAYGFALAAHVKRQGKKAIHLAGSLQLLFGIKGKRWENPNYSPLYNYSELMNEHWVYPGVEGKPKNANLIEGACYW